MNAIRQNAIIFFVISLFAMPALGSLFLYNITGNPYLRPLAISRESLATFDGPTRTISIEVNVQYGVERSVSPSKEKLRQAIIKAFSGHTEAFHFKFVESSGDGIEVTFVVGPNRYGPYPPGSMSKGMIPALEALKYTQEVKDRE